ncbi:MAG: pirin family protein [Candidatus Zixiibacteriota bacterium]|nr:MAG: pirin family protein [candidate division Zixibacteria bacterium]
MIHIRPSGARGQTNLDWLDSRHTFSFNTYRDPAHTHFRKLRVINEDKVKPGMGFGTHSHSDMEILTWVLEGALEHKDSLGNGSIIRPGDLQQMTAGTGIMHSEFNHSQTEPVHFMQIWVFPNEKGLRPGYQQLSFGRDEMQGRLLKIASGQNSDKVVHINQDAELYVAVLQNGDRVRHSFGENRHGWIQVMRGATTVNEIVLEAGDGASISDESTIEIAAARSTEIMLFDLA